MVEAEYKAINKIEFHIIRDMKAFLDEVSYIKKRHIETHLVGPTIIDLEGDYSLLLRKYSVARNEMVYRAKDRYSNDHFNQIKKYQKLELLRHIIQHGLQSIYHNQQSEETKEGKTYRGYNQGSEGEEYVPIPNNSQAIRGFRFKREDKNSSSRG